MRTESDPAATVVVALLGDVSTRQNGQLIPLPGVRARSLLVALAVEPGRSRSAASLIDEVWGDEPPRAPGNALHTQISRLRSALPAGALEAGPAGYRLALRPEQVDLTLAAELARRARELVDDEPAECLRLVERARALWRGDPPEGSGVLGSMADELCTTLDACAAVARLAAGDAERAVAPARELAGRAPLDEPAHALLMRALIGAGRPNEALEVFAGIRARLADQLGADPGPDLVDLNIVALQGVPTDHPVARRTIGLRAAPNPLLGRDADLAAIDAALRVARVVSVLGPGGTGKTRVANEIGTRWAARVPVTMVELASVRSDDDVIVAISATLGLSEIDLKPGGLPVGRVQSARQRLRDALSGGPSLLILDNCEQVIDGVAAVVAELVSAAAELTVLTTSRAPLAITAESVYPLAPLAIGDDGPAVELFRARATAVRPDARIDPALVARLCRTLDGLPLAIELAAARMRTMSLPEIVRRLDHRFALLRGGDRSSPERHRTLHAVIDWSWDLLGGSEQLTLRRMCRFPAGFTMAAAETVAGWGAVRDVATALDGLVNQSLLRVVEDDDTGVVRYRMLETVREYGEERLGEAGEADAVDALMCDWARESSARAGAGFLDERQVATVLELGAEHDNLVAILRHALSVGDAVTGYSVFGVLGVLWAVRGAHSEVAGWAPRVLALDPRPVESEIAGNALVMAYLLAGLHLLVGGDLRSMALVRSRVRRLLRTRTDLDESVRFNAGIVCSPVDGRGVSRLLAETARSAEPRTAANALQLRANIAENLGNRERSRRDAERALTLVTATGDVFGRSSVLQHLGSLAGQSARYAESAVFYRDAIVELLRLHAWDEVAQLRTFRAASLIGAGRLDEARRELDLVAGSVESTAEGPGDQRRAALTAGYAELDRIAGRTDRALAGYRRALDELGWPPTRPTTDPYSLLLVAVVVAAHVLEGRADEVTPIVAKLTEAAAANLQRYPDLPQLGCIAVAIGAHRIAVHGADAGLRLLVLGVKVGARQDYPCMQVGQYLAAARTAMGDERVDGALRETSGMARRRAAEEILRLLTQRLPT